MRYHLSPPVGISEDNILRWERGRLKKSQEKVWPRRGKASFETSTIQRGKGNKGELKKQQISQVL